MRRRSSKGYPARNHSVAMDVCPYGYPTQGGGGGGLLGSHCTKTYAQLTYEAEERKVHRTFPFDLLISQKKKTYFHTDIVQDTAMATIWKTGFRAINFWLRTTLKMVFWTIALLSITFCLFPTSQNSEVWVFSLRLFVLSFHDHLTSMTSGACFGGVAKAFLSHSK